MLLLTITILVALAGIAAIELGQAARPREYPVWNDDTERRLLRNHIETRNWR
jgi:hypothetical protein